MTDEYYSSRPYAVCFKANGPWYIAVKVKASAYTNLSDIGVAVGADVWSEPETTGYLGPVGSEIASIDLQAARLLTHERDEADRRAGAAEREKVYFVNSYKRQQEWLDEAKQAAGYHVNVSFDDVWAEALAALLARRAEAPK